jgi:hypothetical protein
MDRSKLLTFGGVVVGFFLLGQAARSVADGALLLAAVEGILGLSVLVATFRFRD